MHARHAVAGGPGPHRRCARARWPSACSPSTLWSLLSMLTTLARHHAAVVPAAADADGVADRGGRLRLHRRHPGARPPASTASSRGRVVRRSPAAIGAVGAIDVQPGHPRRAAPRPRPSPTPTPTGTASAATAVRPAPRSTTREIDADDHARPPANRATRPSC